MPTRSKVTIKASGPLRRMPMTPREMMKERGQWESWVMMTRVIKKYSLPLRLTPMMPREIIKESEPYH